MTDNIKVIISADGQGYVKTLNRSANETVKWQRTVNTQTTQAAAAYNGGINKIETRLNGLNNKLNSGAALIAGYLSFGALKSGTSAIYERVSSIEDLRTQYAFLLGSEAEAARQEQYLIRLSGQHKKSVGDLAEQYSGLLVIRRAGLVTDAQARNLMEGMSNAQSATKASAEQLKQSLYGVSQALTSPILRMEEFNQVVEPLPGLINAMDEASGLGAGGMRNLVLEGKVTSAYFRDVLIKSFESYEGAAVAMADTLSGKRASAARDYDLLVRKLEQPINESMKAVLEGTSEALQFFTENAEDTALLLGGALAGAIAFYTVKMGAAGLVTVAATVEKRNLIQASIAQAQQEAATAAIAVSAANAKVAALTRQKGAALGAKGAGNALAAAELQAASATTAHKTAIDRLAMAQRGATTAGRGLLTLLGGPLGLAFTALSVGTAFLTMGRDAETSTGGIDNVIDRLDRALGKMKKFELRGLRTDLAIAEKQYEEHLEKTLEAEKTRDYLKRRGSSREAIATQDALKKRQQLLELEERIVAVKAKVKTLEAPEPGTKPSSVPGGGIAPPVIPSGGKDLTLMLQSAEAANTAIYATETARIQAIYSQRHDMIIANTTATGDAREKALQKNTAKYLNEYQSASARDSAARTRDKRELAQLEYDLVLTATEKIEAAHKARNANIARLTKEGSAQQAALMRGSFAQYKADLDAQQQTITSDQKAWADSITKFADPWAGAAASTAQIFGNISEVMKEGNRASFEESKKWASAQAIINGALAATRALAEGGPFLGPALAASIAGVTAIQIKKINDQEYTPAAHGGLGYVPDEQTYLLQKGERVLSPNQNQDFTNFISSGGNKNAGEFIFNMNFYSMDPRGAYQLFMDNKGAVANAALSEFKRRNINLKAA
jgi:tape measure domain-containing protein